MVSEDYDDDVLAPIPNPYNDADSSLSITSNIRKLIEGKIDLTYKGLLSFPPLV